MTREPHLRPLLRASLLCMLLSATGCADGVAPLAWQFAPGDRPGKDDKFTKQIPGYGELSGRFAKGKRTDEWDGRFRDGSTRFQGSFHLGRPVGQHRTFHPDGSEESVRNYDVEGRPEDSWKGWHPNGEPAYKLYFEAGKKVGAWRRWHDDGTLAFRGSYVNDKPAGEWVHFASDGSVVSRHTYAVPDGDPEPAPKAPPRRRGRRPPNAA